MKKVLCLICVIGLMVFVVGCNDKVSMMQYSQESYEIQGEVVEVMHQVVLEESYENMSGAFNLLPIYKSEKYKLVFNEEGMVNNGVYYIEDEVLFKMKHEYDENDLLKSIVYNANDGIEFYKLTETFELDEEENVLMSDNSVILNHDDPKGPNYTLKIVLDENNREIERLRKEGDVFKSIQKTSYHKNGKIEQSSFNSEKGLLLMNYTYNDDNELSGLQVDFKDEVKNYTFEYDYDVQSNWTAQRAYLDGSLISTMMREITYK